MNAAVLFGRKKASGTGEVLSTLCGLTATLSDCYNVHQTPHAFARSERATVPNLGGYLGASAVYRNSKISFGYRADTFFGAMDGGRIRPRAIIAASMAPI